MLPNLGDDATVRDSLGEIRDRQPPLGPPGQCRRADQVNQIGGTALMTVQPDNSTSGRRRRPVAGQYAVADQSAVPDQHLPRSGYGGSDTYLVLAGAVISGA
jgi:hypothetical protein